MFSLSHTHPHTTTHKHTNTHTHTSHISTHNWGNGYTVPDLAVWLCVCVCVCVCVLCAKSLGEPRESVFVPSYTRSLLLLLLLQSQADTLLTHTHTRTHTHRWDHNTPQNITPWPSRTCGSMRVLKGVVVRWGGVGWGRVGLGLGDKQHFHPFNLLCIGCVNT